MCKIYLKFKKLWVLEGPRPFNTGQLQCIHHLDAYFNKPNLASSYSALAANYCSALMGWIAKWSKHQIGDRSAPILHIAKNRKIFIFHWKTTIPYLHRERYALFHILKIPLLKNILKKKRHTNGCFHTLAVERAEKMITAKTFVCLLAILLDTERVN